MAFSTQVKELEPKTNPFMREAMHWRAEADGKLLCELCPKLCRIPDGKIGFCSTRFAKEGKMWAINYGLIAAANVDPMEKKPLWHFKPGTTILSLGGFGCNMHCQHCQNYDISQQHIIKLQSAHEFHSPEDIIDLCHMHKAESIAFTYNEPTIWIEYALDVFKLAKKNGLNTVYVSNGYMTEQALDTIAPYLDAVNLDVKGINDLSYRNFSRAPNWEGIFQRGIEMVHKWNLHVECTTNVVPTINDDDETFETIAKYIANELGEKIPWHITRYHPAHKVQIPATPFNTLDRAREIGKEKGLKFIYLGNVFDVEGDDTWCPNCENVVIQRRNYVTGKKFLTPEGNCEFCGEELGISV